MVVLSIIACVLLGVGLIAAHIGWMRAGMALWVPGALAAAPVMFDYGQRVHAHPVVGATTALLCVGLSAMSAWIFHQENQPHNAR
jgi:hypothetical protein